MRCSYQYIQEVPLSNKYDKILSVAVLEHLEDLPQVIAQACFLLKENSVFQAAVPNEGGLLWYLGMCLTGLGFRLRNKMSYFPLMRYEHLNKSKEIINIIKHFFKDVRVKRFPLPIHHLSMYVYIEAYHPRLDVCQRYLK